MFKEFSWAPSVREADISWNIPPESLLRRASFALRVLKQIRRMLVACMAILCFDPIICS